MEIRAEDATVDRRERRSPQRLIQTLFEVGTTAGLTDGQLLGRFRDRNDEAGDAAFRALVERHGPMVLRVCRSILRDHHAAEDAFQATFLVLARKSGSLQVRDTLGPWLYQVAYRVASCARGAAARRRRHEAKAAEMAAVSIVDACPEDTSADLLHELSALPERYRSVVVLCCLEGLTPSEAARRLGCPLGTVQSRLARGRERLRDRLIRRGITIPGALPGATMFADVAEASMSAQLMDTAIRAARRIVAGQALVDGIATRGAIRLGRLFLKESIMIQVKWASIALVTAAVAAVGVALSLEPRSVAAPEPPEIGTVDGTPAAVADDDRKSEPERFPDRIDFGPLRVGAMADIGAHVFLETDDVWGEVETKVLPPPFLKVKDLRVRERTQREKSGRLIHVVLSIDTSRRGEYSDRVRVVCGNRQVEWPVSARILPADPKMTRVLVVTSSFGDTSKSSVYYRPWFELVDEAKLDVSYLDPSQEGLPFESVGVDREGLPVLPEELKRYDVILVADGGPNYLYGYYDQMLWSHVRGGGRLIVGASSFMADSIPKANEILKQYGLEMIDEDITRGPRDARGWGPFRIEGDSIASDPMTHAISSVVYRRVSPVRVAEDGPGELLIRDPMNPGWGFAAISRESGRGDVIAVGPALLFGWLDEQAGDADNARFMRNLLTAPRER